MSDIKSSIENAVEHELFSVLDIITDGRTDKNYYNNNQEPSQDMLSRWRIFSVQNSGCSAQMLSDFIDKGLIDITNTTDWDSLVRQFARLVVSQTPFTKDVIFSKIPNQIKEAATEAKSLLKPQYANWLNVLTDKKIMTYVAIRKFAQPLLGRIMEEKLMQKFRGMSQFTFQHTPVEMDLEFSVDFLGFKPSIQSPSLAVQVKSASRFKLNDQNESQLQTSNNRKFTQKYNLEKVHYVYYTKPKSSYLDIDSYNPIYANFATDQKDYKEIVAAISTNG